MAKRQWIKLYSTAASGTTFDELDLPARGLWFSLLALSVEGEGVIEMRKNIPYPEKIICQKLNISSHFFRKYVKVLSKSDKIEVINGIIHIKNWKKYQSDWQRIKSYPSQNPYINKGINKEDAKNIVGNLQAKGVGFIQTDKIRLDKITNPTNKINEINPQNNKEISPNLSPTLSPEELDKINKLNENLKHQRKTKKVSLDNVSIKDHNIL